MLVAAVLSVRPAGYPHAIRVLKVLLPPRLQGAISHARHRKTDPGVSFGVHQKRLGVKGCAGDCTGGPCCC